MRGRKPAIPPLGAEDVVDLPSAMDRVPDPPPMLRGLARKLWSSVVGDMVARNTYAEDCRDIVMAYCIQFARFIEAEKDIEKRGVTIEQKSRGGADFTGENLSLKISNNACSLMLRLGSELGLSAVSRKRVQKVRGAGMAAPAMKFLAKSNG